MNSVNTLTHSSSTAKRAPVEIDIQLLTFIERYATNLARWDLLLFFGRNPATCDNALAIARQVGRRPKTVAKELDDLALLGVLHVHENGEGMKYRLARVPATRRAVMRLARCFEGPRSNQS